MTKIVLMHYIKLVFRSVIFLLATCLYIYSVATGKGPGFMGFENNHTLLSVIWILFVFEMILRFFPSKIESMGCQKQFLKNYIPSSNKTNTENLNKGVLTVIISWVTLNSIFGVLYFTGIFSRGIMLLISLFYSVCDIICILFFCPFQTLMMKNKCCGTCRIYNWDYAMMFTPLLFVKNVYSWSLLAIAVILLLTWEITYLKFPERFSENCNNSLTCKNCKEKLCQHKTQLRYFLKKHYYNTKNQG